MKHKSDSVTRYLCEAEVTEGLESVSVAEIGDRFGHAVEVLPQQRAGEIRFYYQGALGRLRSLQTVYAVYVVYEFTVPRPRALLGDAHLRRLLAQIDLVRDLSPHYRSFSIAAAGSDSSVMSRIKQEIVAQTGLEQAAEKGDLLIRVRPYQAGWQTLVRLSPRPLVTRAWRICNLEGALNAATAHAMILLAQPEPTDVYVNLGCGSATLLIERASFGDARAIIGIDNDERALECAQTNIRASNVGGIVLVRANMTALPLAEGMVDQMTADLPFGQLMGDHKTNVTLYPAVLAEAARITRVGGKFTLITHEIHLMDRLLSKSAGWRIQQSIQVNLRGLHPRIYVLRRIG